MTARIPAVALHGAVSAEQLSDQALIEPFTAPRCGVLDLRECNLDAIGHIDIFYLAEQWAKTLGGAALALLIPHLPCARMEFFETCAINRGLALRCFIDPAEALTWIRGSDSPAWTIGKSKRAG